MRFFGAAPWELRTTYTTTCRCVTNGTRRLHACASIFKSGGRTFEKKTKKKQENLCAHCIYNQLVWNSAALKQMLVSSADLFREKTESCPFIDIFFPPSCRLHRRHPHTPGSWRGRLAGENNAPLCEEAAGKILQWLSAACNNAEDFWSVSSLPSSSYTEVAGLWLCDKKK